ncbi:IclR family transcriptional regulator [Amycolatopsis plumensis]|uniref:IclR family transcriptional regulator n=1 Tax=Amycolatopsis plumensis TaxID=236508 RepID=A0ABV5U6R1_9PSEU
MQGSPREQDSRVAGIQVIARAAQMLRTVRQAPGGLTQAELAEKLGLPRSTIHRILSALEEEELVAGSGGPRGRYRIGPEITRLASAAYRDIVGLVHPLLVELSGRLSETVDLSMLDGSQITFIDQVDAPHRLRAVSAVGESFPLHSCAPGKALLATLPPGRVRELLPARLPASTAHTLTSLDELRAQLDQIRTTGIAFDYEEQNDGICAAGIAIELGGLAMAVSVPMPTQRFHGREEDCAEALLRFRDRIAGEEWF